MRVRAVKVTYQEFSEQLRKMYGSQTNICITKHKEYEVHAMALFENSLFLQILCDIDFPIWLSSLLFETADSSIPNDWICNTFDGEPSMVMGPAFVAKSLEAYASIVQAEPPEIDLFWDRVNGLKAAKDET